MSVGTSGDRSGSTTDAAAVGGPDGLAHVRALDGMRAVAVILVFLFHLRVPGFGAGYLGVDVFFVLSGFLITSLLISEMARTGQIALMAFWARRARRLLPALVVLLLVVALATHMTATFSQRTSLRGDLLSAAAYVANWRFIATSSYFVNTGLDSPLQHTWSLAIEEQFYVLWPLLLGGFLLVLRRPRLTVTLLATIGVIASVAALALLYQPGAVERAYMGTDARIFEPMIGALGAVAVVGPRVQPVLARLGGLLVILGLIGVAAGLVVIRPDTAVYYRGGAFLFSVATLLILIPIWIGAGGVVGRVLNVRPLAWLGIVSYGVYLWHWPIILWLHLGEATGLHAIIRGTEVVALTIGVAAVSFYAMERPIRRSRRGTSRRPGLVLVAVPVVLLLVAGASFEATVVPPPAPGVPVMMLVGDSVPLHLHSAFEQVFGARGWRVVSAAAGSCSVTGEEKVSPDGQPLQFSSECRPLAGEQNRMIQTFHPDLILWWDRWSLSDFRTAQGEVIHSGSDRFWQVRRRTLEAAVRWLTTDGARVVFVATEPPGISVWSTLAACPNAQCDRWKRFQVGHYADVTSKWNRLLENFAQQHPDLASFISVTDVVCKKDVAPCDDLIDGKPARPDGTHYVGAGKDEVMAALARLLVPIMQAGKGRSGG